jgi:hypothetical protein
MRFQVPQFIEIEDKIIGPLTFKQFVYLAGGGGAILIIYAFLPLWLTIIVGLPVGLFALALAFYRHNNQPFIKVVENAIGYFLSNKIYLWRKTPAKATAPKPDLLKEKREEPLGLPKLAKGKLEDLAWSLDIKERVTRNE